MNRILLASVAVLGFAGVAAAQQSPELSGNYDAAVLNQYNGTALQGVDASATASIGAPRFTIQDKAATIAPVDGYQWDDRYSGK